MKLLLILFLTSFSCIAQTKYIDGNKSVTINSYITPSEEIAVITKLKIKTSFKFLGLNGKTITIQKTEYDQLGKVSYSEPLYFNLESMKPTDITLRAYDTALPIRILYADNAIKVEYVGGLQKS